MNGNLNGGMVICGLGLICLVCIGGIVYLAGVGQEPPHSLASVASASVGALVGILATPGGSNRSS